MKESKEITISLSMIMKNEALVLPRLLETIYPILDYYVVIDTGSTDNSIQIIKDFFDSKGIKGEVHLNNHCFELIDGENLFNYQKARNYALEKVKDKSDYAFWIDCDEKLLIKDTFNITKFKQELSNFDSVTTITQSGTSRYGRKNFIKNSKPFKWLGAVHEFLLCDENDITYFCNDLETIVPDDNDYTPEKYRKHAKILQKEVDERNQVRDVFYLAQSYKDAGNTLQAIEYYRKRVERTDGFFEERYYSQFMIGNIYWNIGKPYQETIIEFMKCAELDELRAEHYLNMIIILQNNSLWRQAYILSKYCVETYHNKNPYPQRVLFLHEDVYNGMLLDLHIKNLQVLGKLESAMLLKDNMSFDDFLKTIPSGFKQNKEIIEWLVSKINPKVTLELGVDYGYSLICLAVGNKGKVYGIDSFTGDSYTGMRNAYDICKNNLSFVNKNHNIKNIEILRGSFRDISKKWKQNIDILHFDGFPEYDAVKGDYESFKKHIDDKTVLLFHNTNIYPGVAKFFNELDFHKFNYLNLNGLGFASKDKSIIDELILRDNRINPKELITIAYISHDDDVFNRYLKPSLDNLKGDYNLISSDDFLVYPNDQLAAKCNKIIDSANTRYILFVHEDTTFSPDFLNNIHKTINEKKDFGALGIVGMDKNKVYHWAESDKIKEIQLIDSCCLLINKEHGVRFDEKTFDDFHLHVEDYCMQVIEKKLKCYTILTNASEAEKVSEYSIAESNYFRHHSNTVNKLGYSWGRYNEYMDRFNEKWTKNEISETVREVDVCIISYAKTDELRKVTEHGIETLLDSESDENIKFNVFVVESNKDVNYDHYPNTKTIYTDLPFGYNRYLNLARKQGNAPYVALCNSDLGFEDYWASNIISEMESLCSLSASPFCPQTQTKEQYPQSNYFGTTVRKELAGWCIFQKRTIYDIIGDLDESVDFWYSDNIYADQLVNKGILHALVTSSIVNHHEKNLGVSGDSILNNEEKQKLTTGQFDAYSKARRKYISMTNEIV